MKYFLLISLVSSFLLASMVETRDGTFIDIYSQSNKQSDIISRVPVDKGQFKRARCFNTKTDIRWCRVSYSLNDLVLNGYIEENLLDRTVVKINNKTTFEQIYGGRYDEVGNSILVLEDGLLMVGHTQSFGKGQNDVYLMKVDNYGNKIWSSAYGGSLDDVASAAIEIDGGFMVAGRSNSFGEARSNLYLSRVNSRGDLVWQKGYYSDEDNYYEAKDLVAIDSQNVMVAGSQNHVRFFKADFDCYINSISIKGKKNALRNYGGNKMDKANSIIKTSDGYVFAGVTKTWGRGLKDAYVVKIDKKGDRLWHNTFGLKNDEVANQVIATQDGGYIIVGSTDSFHKYQKDIYVVKISENGKKVWQGHYGTRENEEGFGIVEVDDGYVIVGYTKDTKSYSSDVYLLKINKSGYIYWSKKYGGDKDDRGHAIAKVRDGFVITGYKTSAKTANKDLYLLKVDKNGNIN